MEVLTEISKPPRMVFGEVTIDVENRRVRAPVGASSLEPRVFDLLLTLVERPGLTASRDHLIETVWGRGDGSDGALSQAVSKLRQVLGDDDRAPRYIETVPRLGYRWIFEEPPERLRPPAPRWALGPAWVAGGAALAMMVGGLGGVGAYAWVRAEAPDHFEIRKIRMQRTADGRCLKQVQVIHGVGRPTEADQALPRPSSPGCEPPPISREFVER